MKRTTHDEKWVVNHLHNLSMHLRSPCLLLQRHDHLVHHLHGVEAGVVEVVAVMAEVAKVDTVDVVNIDIRDGEGGSHRR